MTQHATLTFLGSSDSQGVPRWWCDCSVCAEAKTTQQNARTRPSALIRGSEAVLIDASPELRLQCAREDLTHFDAALITHAHNDHILGLGDLGDWGRWTRKTCPIYAPEEVLQQLKTRFGYMTKGNYGTTTPLLRLDTQDTLRTFAGYEVTAIKVPHGYNGFSYAFHFQRGGARWGYMPDCLGLEDGEPWRDLDLLILGTSFYEEEATLEKRSVYDVQEAVDLIGELTPKRTIFTHLGHGVDIRKPAPEGARYAFDGLSVDLP